MSAMPMDFIKGQRSAKTERMRVQEERASLKDRIKAMKDKVSKFIILYPVLLSYIHSCCSIISILIDNEHISRNQV